jgi:outer membrane protein assembly factor BamB
MLRTAPLLALLLAFSTPWLCAGNWPQWRGPLGTGVSQERGLPTHWTASENVAWKVPMADRGNSTPIVWGERVFITAAIEKEQKRGLVCFDRADGKLLWEQYVVYEEPETTHQTNPYCSASPVTDGQCIVAWHGSAGIYAYDLAGKELWRRDLGKFDHIWGNAASPILYGDLVITSCGPGLTCFLVALDKRTGEEVWRRDLPEAQSKTPEQFYGSWSTPVLRPTAARDELLLSLPRQLRALDPKSGRDLWRTGGLTDLVYTSPVYGDGLVVAMSGYHGAAIGVQAASAEQGELSEEQRLWRIEKNPQRVGSGVIVGEYLYILNEPGVAYCMELKTGKNVWEERLGGKSWSSMVYADGRLYVAHENGETSVLEASPEFKLIAKNPLARNDLTRASLACSDGQIFIRTYQNLYCIGERKPSR